MRYACEEITIGRGLIRGEDPTAYMRNSLEYVAGVAVWRCTWRNSVSQLVQTAERRVPRSRTIRGSSRPMTALEFLAAKEKARILLLEEVRGLGCDVNSLAVAESALAAPNT